MISGPDFIWLHVPKCAGHTVEMALRAGLLGRSDVNFDTRWPEYIGWHDSLRARMERIPDFQPGTRRIIAGFRRLPVWILSRVHYEVARAPHHCATRDMIRRGAYFEQSGHVSTADDVIRDYATPGGGLPGVTHWLRSDHMAQDFEAAFGGTFGRRKALAMWQLKRVRNPTSIDYVKSIPFHFSQADLETLYNANPIWAALEEKLYGATLLDAPARQPALERVA